MGAWGVRAFDNDEACDWADELAKMKDLSLVEKTIETTLVSSHYLDAWDGECALAACEVIARLLGNSNDESASIENIDKWVAEYQFIPPRNLVERARRVIDIVMSDSSELAELWEDNQEWIDENIRLKDRLAQQ
jgi:hypothetical protein